MRVASHDPADGGDNKGYAMRHGTIVLDVDEHTVGDGNVGCDWATGKAIRDNADMFVYDADGMGALLRRQINTVFEGKGTRIEAFKGSEGVDDPKAIYQGKNDLVDESRPRTNADTFRNKRSQKYISLADRFYLTYQHIVNGVYADPDDMISISSNVPNIGKLRSELCRIPLTENGAGYIQVMTKLEMKKKHKINSPGMADSVYMLWGVPMKRKAEVKPLNLRRSV
jgi:phage terminase large subunit